MTAALQSGEWSAAQPGRTLPLGNTRYPFYRRLGGPQGRPERAEKLVHTEIRSRIVQASRLRAGNACYYSVQNLLSSRLLSKNLKIKIYRTIILPIVLYGCETWSLTLREERKLRAFENMVLRRIFGPRRDEVTGNGGVCITRS